MGSGQMVWGSVCVCSVRSVSCMRVRDHAVRDRFAHVWNTCVMIADFGRNTNTRATPFLLRVLLSSPALTCRWQVPITEPDASRNSTEEYTQLTKDDDTAEGQAVEDGTPD